MTAYRRSPVTGQCKVVIYWMEFEYLTISYIARMVFFLPLLFALGGVASATTFQPLGSPFKNPVTVASGLSAEVIFSNLTVPRGITFDSQNNLLVVERGFGVTAFTRVTSSVGDGWERTVVVSNPTFTHGIQVDGPRLFVSTGALVQVYQYDASTRSVSGTPYTLIDGVPADGGSLSIFYCY